MTPLTTRRLEVPINPGIPGYAFLSDFRFKECRIGKVREALPHQTRMLTVELLHFRTPHRLTDAFTLIRDMGDRRFLTAYELLSLDRCFPELQMEDQIVTPHFALGMDPREIGEHQKRSHFGKVIADTEVYDDHPMNPFARYATTPYVTDVDRGTFEDGLDRYLYNLYKRLLLTE
jgi:hypothetical protein